MPILPLIALLALAPGAPAATPSPSSPAAAAAAPRSVVDAARAQTEGLTPAVRDLSMSASWLASRYGVSPPAIDSERYGSLWGRVDIHAITPASEADRAKLWTGIQKDLAPNSALVEKGKALVWIVSIDAKPLEHGVTAVGGDRSAEPPKDLDWLAGELPPDIPGLKPAYRMYLPDLPELEIRSGGVSLRAVSQNAYRADGVSMVAAATQAEFWVPRRKEDAGKLAAALDRAKKPGQAVLTGKGTAVLAVAFRDRGLKVMVDYLTGKGYKLVSPPAFPDPPPSPAPAAAPPAPPSPGKAGS
jgi:hypothetical protein